MSILGISQLGLIGDHQAVVLQKKLIILTKVKIRKSEYTQFYRSIN